MNSINRNIKEICLSIQKDFRLGMGLGERNVPKQYKVLGVCGLTVDLVESYARGECQSKDIISLCHLVLLTLLD